jgi:hypothetical protein
MSETTLYRARAPNGFYAQLMKGQIPKWLEPVKLPPTSPFRLWKISAPSPQAPPPAKP